MLIDEGNEAYQNQFITLVGWHLLVKQILYKNLLIESNQRVIKSMDEYKAEYQTNSTNNFRKFETLKVSHLYKYLYVNSCLFIIF